MVPKAKRQVVPEILRNAMRNELERVVAFPREIIENEDLPAVDRLAAWELLAKYGVGVQREVKGEMHHTHGVVSLPPIGGIPLANPETVIEADDIELVD